jgi:hypothetical protein
MILNHYESFNPEPSATARPNVLRIAAAVADGSGLNEVWF